jgi:type I restriction enzyme M protein
MPDTNGERDHVTQPRGFDDKVAFIWAVADLLRGDFKAHEYGQVVLPFTVLRRLECALEPTKATVINQAKSLQVANPDPILKRVAGQKYYNTSVLDLATLLQDPGNVAANLHTYLAEFSPEAAQVLQEYGFEDKIARLDKAGLLYQVVAKFAELDLTPDSVPNEAMGYIFEELLRRFSEMSNETAGEHFTPREVIRLMVNILFSQDDKALSGQIPVRTLYDPACGTGGMLTVAQDHLGELNPDAVLEVFGQELNPETWAVCRSDLMIKGQDPSHIALGNSFTDDGFTHERFDYLLANPPFGVDWKKYQASVKDEHDNEGFDGRFGPGLPRVSDGSLLFLMHMISKMKPVADDPVTPDIIEGGTRLAIVFSGSPLFAGAAGGGESEIRRWVIENDWLEGIVALPDQLFYNTGISTYFWILTNRKTPDRRGKIVLVDARESWAKMRKSLGDKRKYIPDDAIAEVTRLYADALDHADSDKRVKVFNREDFGYQRITVERPRRRRWQLTYEAIDDLAHSKAWETWATPPKKHPDPVTYLKDIETQQARLLETLRQMLDVGTTSDKDYAKTVKGAAVAADVDLPDKIHKEIVKTAETPDPDAPVITNRKGEPEPDPDLRDQENIPLPAGYLSLTAEQQSQALVDQAEQHLQTEIRPYAPDAWIDHTKTKIGYEIPLTRHFYEYTPPRPLGEIDAELQETEQRIQELLTGLVR